MRGHQFLKDLTRMNCSVMFAYVAQNYKIISLHICWPANCIKYVNKFTHAAQPNYTCLKLYVTIIVFNHFTICIELSLSF